MIKRRNIANIDYFGRHGTPAIRPPTETGVLGETVGSGGSSHCALQRTEAFKCKRLLGTAEKKIAESGKVCSQLLLRTEWHIQTRAFVLWAWQLWRDASPAGIAWGGGRDGAADQECGLGFSLQLRLCCHQRNVLFPGASPHVTHALVWVYPCPPSRGGSCPRSTWKLMEDEGFAQARAMSPQRAGRSLIRPGPARWAALLR